jgi:hypothetical protein
MAIVACILNRIKQELEPFLSEQMIESCARQAGHKWRERKLTPVVTVQLFILQVLHFNTAMTHPRHLAKVSVKAPAYCRARMRLPLKVLQDLLVKSSQAMRDSTASPQGLWCGLRAHLVDGSSTIAPDNPIHRRLSVNPRVARKAAAFPFPKCWRCSTPSAG